MRKNITIITGVLTLTDIAFFAGLMMTTMTDDRPPAIAGFFYNTLKHVLGFPLVLINSNFPFFLDSSNFSVLEILLVVANNLLLAFAIAYLIKLVSGKSPAKVE